MDLRALVVCPDQDSAKLLSVVLSELGMTVDHTPSISRGFELVESQRFDAIVFDYRADQSSEEFLARLRQSAVSTPARCSDSARTLFSTARFHRSARASVCAPPAVFYAANAVARRARD